MAVWSKEAWVTSVLDDSNICKALVLASSIRRTGTTRNVVAITSLQVSFEHRSALRRAFDVVVLLEESFGPNLVMSSATKDTLSKAYVSALTSYKKCIYVAPGSLFLKNVDILFQNDYNFQTRAVGPGDGLGDLSVFKLFPQHEKWIRFYETAATWGKDISDGFTGKFLTDLKAGLAHNVFEDVVISDFVISSGKLLCDQTQIGIVHFVSESGSENMEEQMNFLKNKSPKLGIREKVILQNWMDLHDQVFKPEVCRWSTTLNWNGYTNEPIAIVGMSCRYPGANNLEEFWSLLYAGEEALGEPPTFRWTKEHTIKGTSSEDKKSQAGFLKVPVDEFDAGFFGVSPKEAQYMDPQTRLLHEVTWESLEDAGINPQSLYGTHAGIFTGSWMNDYKEIVQGSSEKDFFRTYMGSGIGAAAARLSHLLGLTGPSIATESGCSSAIVALDLAVKSLRNGETNLALAGGVNLLLHPFKSKMMEFVISPTGRCKTFDAKADGFARAEGCGVLVLKRLGDAVGNGDNIWAVIRGSAISQEGLSRSLGTPTVHCEALAMKLALKDANVTPEEVSFVETHGTGTQVGDPMEVAAIAKAYYSPNRKTPLVLGSVKTNVGHTESCSGITGIMKAVLAMQHELIPKHRNLDTLNPEIFLDSIPATIPMENLPWPKVQGQPRLCGVSSFGITGTDGHVILEEAPDVELPKFDLGMERPMHLMTISGKTRKALDELLHNYANRFSKHSAQSDISFANVAYSANVGRSSFTNRAILVARNCQEAADIINEEKCLLGETKDGCNSRICFLFTGQGSQYPGMAKILYDTSPVFRINFDACNRSLRENYNLSIQDALWDSDPKSKELSRTIYSQTSIFCVEYCLFKLWQSWGIKPDYVLGHSLGEFCAAVAAGVLTFEDALKLVAERSRLIDNLPRGSMLVIKASKPEVERWMNAAKIDLDFAAVNNPDQTVVAGDTKVVESFLAFLKTQGTKAIILEATHAFHSRHMDPMLEEYRKVAHSINYKRGNPNIQYVSGMEGRLIDDVTELGPKYWVRHTREKVSFIDACNALSDLGCQDFLEVGPQPVLSSFVMSNNEGTKFNCLPSLRRGTNDWETMLTSLGKLYLLGYQVDWKAYDEPYIRKKVSLPFHPFHRKSFWVEYNTKNNTPIIHPLLGYQIKNATALPIYQNDLKPKFVHYLKDHCIGSRIIFPGAAFTEMCLSAAYFAASGCTETLEPPSHAIRLENLKIEAPLALQREKTCCLQTVVTLPEPTSVHSSGFQVTIYHQQNTSGHSTEKWVPHARSTVIPVASTKRCMKFWNPNRIPEILSHEEPNPTEHFYTRVDEAGLKFGESFRMLQRYWASKQVDCEAECDEVVAEMKLPADSHKYLLHPLIIDAIFQMGYLALFRYTPTKLKVPVNLGNLTLFPGILDHAVVKDSLYLHLRQEENATVLFITTANWTPVAFAENIELLETTSRTIESVLEEQSNPLPEAWEETWRLIAGPFDRQVPWVDKPENQFFDAQLLQLTEQLGRDTKPEVQMFTKAKRLIYLYILSACQQLGWKPEVGEKLEVNSFCKLLGIQSKFGKLVRFYFTVFEEATGLLRRVGKDANLEEKWLVMTTPPGNDQTLFEINLLLATFKKSENFAKVSSIYKNIGNHLPDILTGKMSALTLLFPGDESNFRYSADAFYQHHPRNKNWVKSSQLVMSAIFQKFKVQDQENGGKGVYRVLEVGAGVGSLSGPLMSLLRDVWGSRFEYYYTDISPAFFINAEQKFEEFRENMKFEVFNIEQAPLGQGIPLGYFDMVCATDVLHATRNLEQTLGNLRQTLRPGGMLCFSETVVPSRDITFIFGLLEGYWRFEDLDWRLHHCCVREEVWKELTCKTGFRDFHCFKTFVNQFGCMTAVADSSVPIPNLTIDRLGLLQDKKTLPLWLVFADKVSFKLFSQVATVLTASGTRVVLVANSEDEQLSVEHLEKIGMLEFVRVDSELVSKIDPFLNNTTVQGVIYAWGMNQNERNQENLAKPFLQLVQALLAQKNPPKLFVLTQGVHGVTEDTVTEHPSGATLMGMAKSLKNECFDLFVRCMDLEQGASVEEQVSQVLFELAMHKGAKEQHRLQVAYRGGLRYEPRFCKATLAATKDELKLPSSTDRYHLVLPKSKLIQDLSFAPLDVESVGDAEIEVKVKAYALNFRDIFAILKPSNEFEKLNGVGLDFAGVVTKVGEGSGLKLGERVFGCNFKDDQLPSHLIVESNAVTSIPDKMTYWEAATLPAVFSTAYHCLISTAQMKKGDKVLIHTGSGGVGLAAIQLAKMVGAEIITTAGTPRKRAYLRSLGIQHVFKSRDTSYEEDILRVTNGQGVDIVLNSITGPGIKEATLRATAKNGRFVEMSKLSVWTPDEVKALRPDVDYFIVDLTTVDQEIQTDLLRRLYHSLVEEKMKPIPFVKFDALRIRQALQYFQKAKHIGKVVVTMPEVSTSQGQYKPKVSLFNSESTYLITGGLGGIGFEVCKWMLEQGATDIVLTGRTPPAPDIMQQIRKLQSDGFNVQIKLGDIGNPCHCHALIQEVLQSMKPLRGIMHCAGVLRDGLYPNQSWDAFQVTFNPKVNGSWNLHESTKHLPLEHFVTYSSITALIGTLAQPNHAAANCFEDAFIHYRHSLGLPGLSINWGQWAQVGCAKEINVSGFAPICISRMLGGLALALRMEKSQVAFVEFSSITNLTSMCPMTKQYLDDKIIQKSDTVEKTEMNKGADQFSQEIDRAVNKSDKLAVLSRYLNEILCKALRLDRKEELSPTANLQELGVDSLMMIELKNSIQSLLGSRTTISANLLKNCHCIQDIGAALMTKFETNADNPENGIGLLGQDPLPSAELLDMLTKDAHLPDWVQVAPDTWPALKPSQFKTVLVTGATGQLAPYLIAEICKSYKFVEKIVCLVKATDDVEAMQKLKVHFKALDLGFLEASEKIEAVAGNVTLGKLGICEEKYKELCQNVDAVTHCAAKVNLVEHLKAEDEKLTDCRSVNILGFINVLKFACSLKTKHVFYPSSMFCGILGETEDNMLADDWPEAGVIQTIVDHQLPGLLASKWIGELLLKQANDRGIPGKVIRFPLLAGNSKTGRADLRKNLNAQRFIHFLKLGVMPGVVVPATALPVDICAQVSLKLFMGDNVPNEVFNVTHPQPQMEQEFVQLAWKTLGIKLEIVGWTEYLERFNRAWENTKNKESFHELQLLGRYYADAFQVATKYTLAPNTFFQNRKVGKFIPNYGNEFPSSMETLVNDLNFLKANNLLGKFEL